MSNFNQVTVLNTPCLLTNRKSLADAIADTCKNLEGKKPISVDFTNVHIVTLRTTDHSFLNHTSNIDWFVSDSQILTWAISLLGGRNHSRIYGPDFLSYFFQSGPKNLNHAFLGGSQDCLSLLCDKVRKLQPEVHIVSSQNGYFKPEENETIINNINQSNADILWVGLGTPKQQQWIHENKSRLNVSAILAVGFAFDVNAGTKKDAPAWLGPLGLIWLYRLLSEPKRLWKRYFIYNNLFLVKLLLQLITGRPTNK